MRNLTLALALLVACKGEKTDKKESPAAAPSAESPAPGGGGKPAGEKPAGDDQCRRFSSCELTSQADFAAAIGSTIAPHEKPQGNSKQIYHCAVDSHDKDPYADVSINCRTDGRTHEQYMLAYNGAKSMKGFQEVSGMGRSAFWLSMTDDGGSLEVEADDSHVIIVALYSMPGGKALDGAKALASKIMERALKP